MRKIKHLLISAIAGSLLICSFASAHNYSESWYVEKIRMPGVPSNAGTSTCTRTVVYSTYGERTYMNYEQSSLNGGNGYVQIDSVNGTMNTKYVCYVGDSALCKPTITGPIDGAEFLFTPINTTYNSTYTANGNIVTMTS